MNLYFAPMEAVTTYNYRNAHYDIFGHVDRYYSPFISPTIDADFRNKEMRDILPENNSVPELIPQLMTHDAEVFVKAAGILKELGYSEVNLNLGCPSKTVTAKKKGSGFLRFPEEIDQFFEEVFSKLDMKVSVKTRAGYFNHEELIHLMEIYNKYPISELTIHPRIQKDMYNNTPDMEIFRRAYEMSKIPVCYNGDVRSIEDYERIVREYPGLSGIMIGRGLLAHPALTRQIKKGASFAAKNGEIREFHDRLYSEYKDRMGGEKNVLFKMKELWGSLLDEFPDNSKMRKRIMKTQRLHEYDAVVAELFSQRVDTF